MADAAITTNATPVAPAHVPQKDKLVDYVVLHSGALISAVVVIIVGVLAARWIGKLVERWLERKAMEPPVRMLLVRITKLLVFAAALVVALGTAGMDVTALFVVFFVVGVFFGLVVLGVLGF